MMHWKKRLLILCIGVPILTWGESQTGHVNGDAPDAVVHFNNKVDGSYEMRAAPTGLWQFTDKFEWSGPNGWYSKGERTYEIACEKLDSLKYTAFVDASLCFGARMNGQMYISSNEAGNTIPWSVSSAYHPSPQPYIDPAEALIAVGETKSFRYGYDNIFYTNPGGLWKYSGTDVDGNSVQIDWHNAGANYSLPTTLKAGQYMLTAARNIQGAFSAYASAKIIQVKSVSAGEVTSTVDSSATSIPTLYVERKDNTTITITATPEPGSDWPANYPSWSGGGSVDSNDPAKYIIPGNVAASYTVTAKCGNQKVIKIAVVEIEFDPSPVDYIILAGKPVPVKVTITPSEVADKVTFAAEGKNVSVTGTTESLTVTALKTGSDTIKAKIGNLEIGSLAASVIENPEIEASAISVVDGAPVPPENISSGTWGICNTANVDVEISAGRSGDKWVPIVTSIKGNYYIFFRLINGVREVTGPEGNTTQENWRLQRGQLRVTTYYADTWYMLKAVEDHERVHEKRMAPALKDQTIYRSIEKRFEEADGLGVAFSFDSRTKAIAALKACAGFQNATEAALTFWDAKYTALITNDHGDQGLILDDNSLGQIGVAYQAELNATQEMRTEIAEHAKAQNWK